jgi:hypothetical protein
MTDNFVSTRKKLLQILKNIKQTPVRGPHGGAAGGVLSGGVLSGGVLSGGKKRGRPRKRGGEMMMNAPGAGETGMSTMAAGMHASGKKKRAPRKKGGMSAGMSAGMHAGMHAGMRGGDLPAIMNPQTMMNTRQPSTTTASSGSARPYHHHDHHHDKPRGGRTVATPGAMNPWITHVKRVQMEKNLPWKEALRIAATTYRR